MPFGSDMDAWDGIYYMSASEESGAQTTGSARPSSELDHGGNAHPRASFFGGFIGSSRAVRGSSELQSAIAPALERSSGHSSRRSELDDVDYDMQKEDFIPFSSELGPRQEDMDSALQRPFSTTLKDAKMSAGPAAATSYLNGGLETAAGLHASYSLPLETTSTVAAERQQRDPRRAKSNLKSPLALVERRRATTWLGLTFGEIKLLALAGAGFMMDSYDLFIINLIYPILLRVYYPAEQTQLDWGLSGGVLKASANMGNVIGQLLFGFLGDFWGRSVLYGKELALVIFAIILMISAPDQLGGLGVTIWICVFRALMGIGIGGDYALSGCIVADRASLKTRGVLLAIIFSNQGWGTLAGSLMSIIVISAYKPSVIAGDVQNLGGAWRILQGAVLVPSFIVLYFRLTLVESSRFVQARYLQDHPDYVSKASAAGLVIVKDVKDEEIAMVDMPPDSPMRFKQSFSPSSRADGPAQIFSSTSPGFDALSHDRAHTLHKLDMHGQQKRGPSAQEVREALRNAMANAKGWHFKSVGLPHNEFWKYFKEWTHFRRLLGTTLCWFLVDITFYGINLNQTSLLAALHYTQGDIWTQLMKTATGNLIVVLAGFLPGYFITIALIETRLGRKKIQMLGFFVNAVMFLILALIYPRLETQPVAFFICFVILQLSFNFGANATTFIIPAEQFPTKVRATALGVSAACGKLGSIISALGFSTLASSNSIGPTGVFWIFLGVSIAGLIATVLLIEETRGFDPDALDREEMVQRRLR
ncbi:MFS general substrate transporter [Tilletiaria anomala UBC 951]|uniref:MFS general substrate transporter n=1 Tax=Tilletiaria anomala (strain ATCC 24038 / CBS 436.72 / UBC 951) TaxID=1037660 RepID=A0A066WF16_TILAU|nr:MFS general substrate transporter [Tilletiaria anomala UBC 951]KDN52562.1 MFS general substrate transporter [Tilletiaria anomala UBC 951]